MLTMLGTELTMVKRRITDASWRRVTFILFSRINGRIPRGWLFAYRSRVFLMGWGGGRCGGGGGGRGMVGGGGGGGGRRGGGRGAARCSSLSRGNDCVVNIGIINHKTYASM